MQSTTDDREGSDIAMVLLDLWDILRENRIMFFVFMSFVVIPITILAALKPYYYQASAQAMIVEDMTNLGNSPLGALQSASSLLGINTSSNTRLTAIATLKSRKFAASFLKKYGILAILYPGIWLPDGEPAPDSEMSEEVAVKLFKTHYYRLEEDKLTSLITVKIKWTDPGLATNWANLILSEANLLLRNELREGADRKIAFLEGKLAGTSNVEVRNSLLVLLQAEIKKSMLVDADPTFPIRVIDPATTPFETTTTATFLILLSLFIGFLFALPSTLFMSHFIKILSDRKEKSTRPARSQ